MYGIFTYIGIIFNYFRGQCREIFHTWILWERTICRWCDSIDLAILNGDGSHMWNHRQHIPIEPWPLQEPLTAVFPALSHGSRTYWWTKVNLPVQVSKHGPWGYAKNGIKLDIKPTKNGDLHGLEEKNFKNDCRFILIYLDLSSFQILYPLLI